MLGLGDVVLPGIMIGLALRFDLFMQRRLFDPLGMVDTRFQLDHEQARRLVTGHIRVPETGKLRAATDAERLESTFPMGGTSFKSTAMDYARVLITRQHNLSVAHRLDTGNSLLLTHFSRLRLGQRSVRQR